MYYRNSVTLNELNVYTIVDKQNCFFFIKAATFKFIKQFMIATTVLIPFVYIGNKVSCGLNILNYKLQSINTMKVLRMYFLWFSNILF